MGGHTPGEMQRETLAMIRRACADMVRAIDNGEIERLDSLRDFLRRQFKWLDIINRDMK